MGIVATRRSVAGVCAVLAVIAGVNVGYPTTAVAEPLQILLIGNSMSRGITRPLRRMLRHAGFDATVASQVPGIWSLSDHAASRRTRNRLAARAWDYVVLQEQSIGIFEGAGYDAARSLHAEIQRIGAETGFLMTWRERGRPTADYDSLRGVVGGTAGYVPIAHELGAFVAPVGWAIRTSIADGTPYDLWKGSRGRHLASTGRYLAACVLYAAITQQSPLGVPGPNRFDPVLVDYLQRLAADTISQDRTAWNLETSWAK